MESRGTAVVIHCFPWQVIGRPTTYHFMLKSTTWAAMVWCGGNTAKTSPTTSVLALKSSAGTRPKCTTWSPSNTSWDTTVRAAMSHKTSACWGQWTNSKTVLFQTTREIRTPRDIHVKPSVVVTIWDRERHDQGAAMTLRWEEVHLKGKNDNIKWENVETHSKGKFILPESPP